MAASFAHIAPTVTVKKGPSPGVDTSHGGPHIGSALQTLAGYFSFIAGAESHIATTASIRGSYHRREEEWQFQIDSAIKEIEQIENQIQASEIRKAIVENELKNHDLQAENAKEVDTYMRNKFTNKQLYSRMVSQITGLYFQSYKLSYDLARCAEKTFQYELGISDSDYIQFGYWDSLKKGLLAGEKLHYDLKRMDVAYLEQNSRECEITKHISLAMLNPIALVMLKETGTAYFNLPEALFDLDYSGHYMRRIKSLSLTIPCVTGAYTSVSCTLTLHKSSIRIDNTLGGGQYARIKNGDDSRFSDVFGATQSIATSSAQNDSGLFQLNFHDERYLPFEGAGAISSWHIELPDKLRQFDYDTISDVVIHLSYTAREGVSTFKDKVEKKLTDALNKMLVGKDKKEKGLSRIFSARHEFPNEWHQFFQLMKEGNEQGYKHKIELDLSKERFPYQFHSEKIAITGLGLFMKLKEEFGKDNLSLTYELKRNKTSQIMKDKNQLKNFLDSKTLLSAQPSNVTNTEIIKSENWLFEIQDIENDIPESLRSKVKIGGVDHDRLNPDAVEDLLIVIQYSIA